MSEVFVIVLFALSLCADCFAVSVCSSVTLKKVTFRSVFITSLIFGFVQSGLLVAGWAFGDIFVTYIQKIAKLLGFLLLAYVALSMLRDSLRKDCDYICLNSMKNVAIGAVATSIDAFVVGISQSMAMITFRDILVRAVAVFVLTFLSVILGIYGGHKIGSRWGKVAEILGAIVLLLIGFDILFDFL